MQKPDRTLLINIISFKEKTAIKKINGVTSVI